MNPGEASIKVSQSNPIVALCQFYDPSCYLRFLLTMLNCWYQICGVQETKMTIYLYGVTKSGHSDNVVVRGDTWPDTIRHSDALYPGHYQKIVGHCVIKLFGIASPANVWWVPRHRDQHLCHHLTIGPHINGVWSISNFCLTSLVSLSLAPGLA